MAATAREFRLGRDLQGLKLYGVTDNAGTMAYTSAGYLSGKASGGNTIGSPGYLDGFSLEATPSLEAIMSVDDKDASYIKTIRDSSMTITEIQGSGGDILPVLYGSYDYCLVLAWLKWTGSTGNTSITYDSLTIGYSANQALIAYFGTIQRFGTGVTSLGKNTNTLSIKPYNAGLSFPPLNIWTY